MSGRKIAPFIMIQNVANAIMQLGLVIMISRVLGAEGAGHYSLAQSYVMPAFFLGLFALKTQYLIARERPDLSDYLGLRVLGGGLIFLLAGLCALVLENPYIALLVLALGFVKFFDGFVDILTGVFQKSKDPGFIARTAVTRLFLLMSAFAGVFYQTQDISLALLALGFAGFIHFFLIEYRWCRKHARFSARIFDFDPEAMRRRIALAKTGLPISLSVLLGTAQISVVRIFLENFHGAEVLGRFSVTLQLILIGNLFVVAMGQAFMPALSGCFGDKDKAGFMKIAWALSGFVVLCVLCGAGLSYVAGEQLIELVFGAQFAGLGGLLVLGSFCALPFFLNAVFTQFAIACTLQRLQLYVYALGFVLACVLGFVMTQHYAMSGAYISIFAVNFVQSCALGVLIFKVWFYGDHRS